MLLLPLAGAGLIWGWVGSMRMIENPQGSFNVVVGAVVFLTAILAAVDVSALSRSMIGIPPSNGPGAWFLFVLLVWVIGFPAYLAGRSKSGATSYAVAGILVTLVFLGVAGWYGYAIHEATAELQRRLDSLRGF